MLVQKRRLKLPITTQTLRQRCLASGMQEIGMDGEIGVLACQLDLHGDPADRIIVATCLQQGATLMTADQKILSWQQATKPLTTINART